MTHKSIISLAAVLIATLALSSAYAKKGRAGGPGRSYGSGDGSGSFEPGDGRGRGHGHRGFGKGDRGMRWLKFVDLTPSQKQQIQTLKDETKADAAPLREKARELREQMRALWQTSTLDEGAILDMHKQIHDIRGQLAEMNIQLRIDVIGLLTPEQKAQMQEFKAQREERRAERRAARGERRGNRQGKRQGKRGQF